MLSSLCIRDFAIIDQSSLELNSGMTALTGETGAGKSILLGAVGLLLGDRASANSVRQGAERADISAIFELNNPAVSQWLIARELDSGDELQIRRTLIADGKSRAYINGRASTLSDLKALGSLLINIHGQHEHQNLLKPQTQRQLLDNHGQLAPKATKTREAFNALRTAEKALFTHREQRANADALVVELERELRPFSMLEVGAQEIDALIVDHRNHGNLQRLVDLCEVAYARSQDDGGCLSQCHRLRADLQSLAALDFQLTAALELVDTALINLEEANSSLSHYRSTLDADPQRIAWVETQFSALFSLSRKYNCEPENVLEQQQILQAKLERLQNIDDVEAKLETEYAQCHQHYIDCAGALSQARKTNAELLSAAISKRLHALSMSAAQLHIEINTEPTRITGDGFDKIEFKIATNAGQIPQPLSQIASGGELSRISLAIQVCLSDALTVPTLIFDEVDAGIGGAVAEVVGQQMREIGQRAQVLCVTHLAQVAAKAHHQLRVQKSQSNDAVSTEVMAIQNEERINELARMLGGRTITDAARATAKELMD